MVVFPVRAARDDEQLLLERQAHRLALLLGQGQAGLLLDPRQAGAMSMGDTARGARRRSAARARTWVSRHAARRDRPPGPRRRLHDDGLLGSQRSERSGRRVTGISSVSSVARSSSARGRTRALVRELLERVQNPRRGAQRRISRDAKLAGDLVRRLEADPPDVPGQSVGILRTVAIAPGRRS